MSRARQQGTWLPVPPGPALGSPGPALGSPGPALGSLGRALGLLGLALGVGACGDPPPDARESGSGEAHSRPETPLEEPPGLAAPWSAPPDPAGSAGCAECHAEHTESWSRTGMARALSAVDPDEFEGLTAVSDGPFTYHFESDADGARIVETCAAVPEHRQVGELAYAIGAGVLDRAFVALRGEFEWFAPLEIVSLPGGRHTALAPGHMAVPDQRFTVGITPECLGCHTDRLPPPAFPLNVHQGERFEPRGISCGACHGAVEDHARLRRAERDSGEPVDADPVLRPGELSRLQRMSMCAACHLQGDVRISLDGNLGAPLPGTDMLEDRAVFVAREPDQDVGFVSQTERLVLSTCYLESPSMACDTCHDPHRMISEEGERTRVRNACQLCHPGDLGLPDASASACSRPPEARASERDCASCHMRKTPTYDVAEVEIQDHYIRRHPGAPSRQRTPRVLESPGADWTRFTWPGEEPPEHIDDPGLWMMALAHRGELERAAALLGEASGPRIDRIAMLHHTRGSLLERIGRPAEAVGAYERALALDADLAPAAINLGLLYGLGGDHPRGIALLSEVIARHPEAVSAYRNRAGLRYEVGDAAGFQSDLTAAYALHPLAELAEILSDWFASSGNPALAETWAARARDLDPIPRPGR